MSEYPIPLKMLVCEEIVEMGRKPAKVAEKYDLNLNTVYSWISKYKKNKSSFIGKGHLDLESQLRKEIELLKEENDFLIILENILSDPDKYFLY